VPLLFSKYYVQVVADDTHTHALASSSRLGDNRAEVRPAYHQFFLGDRRSLESCDKVAAPRRENEM